MMTVKVCLGLLCIFCVGICNQTAFAYIAGSGLPAGMDAFPLNSTFQYTDAQYGKSGKTAFLVKKLSEENGTREYSCDFLEVLGTNYLIVDTDTNRIIEYKHNICALSFFIGDITYDHVFNELLPVITGRYGNPTEEGYTEYQGRRYKYIKFHEDKKYEYYYGVHQRSGDDEPWLWFLVRAL